VECRSRSAVVTLAEHFGGTDVTAESYAHMVREVAQYVAPFAAEHGSDLRDMHMLGTSGTVTTLAGVPSQSGALRSPPHRWRLE
jgi:exopolyphosphatase/pppGpp-phosphohydrolase